MSSETMNTKGTKHKIIKVVQLVFLLSLYIISMVSMKKVFDQFVSNDTSMKQSENPIEEYPTIMICIKSEYEFPYQDGFTISWDGLELHLGNETDLDEYDVFVNEIPNYDSEEPAKVMFQKIYSHLSGKPCYKIKEFAKERIKAEVKELEMNFKFVPYPKVEMFLTSEKNSDGIIFAEWTDGQEKKLEFQQVTLPQFLLYFRSQSSNNH